jgi:hypothetical protein
MANKDIIFTAGAVGLSYYALVHVLKLIPDPLKFLGETGEQISAFLSHPFQTQKGLFVLTKESGLHGESIGLAASGLKPNTPVNYGWKFNLLTGFIGYNAQLMTNEFGELIMEFTIADTTRAGSYQIYVNQEWWGGPYGEHPFTVLEGHV